MKKKLLPHIMCMALIGLSSQLIAQTPITPELTSTIKTDQTAKIFRTMSFGINAGNLISQSLVSTRSDFSNYSNRLGYGFYLKKQVGHTLGFQADFLAGSVRGSNSGRPNITTPWTFDTDLRWSASFSTNVTFGNISFLKDKSAILPYGTFGVGIIDYSSVVTSRSNVKSPAETGRMLFIPVSIGTKIVLSSVINLDLGYKIGFVDSDNFDGIRGGGPQRDNFSYGYAGLEFILGKKSRPALGVSNPITGIKQSMNEKYDDLRKQMDSEKASIAAENDRMQAENAKLIDEQKKFMTDADNDGVSDYFDKCPATPTTIKVDGAGCPLPTFVINKPADVKVFITESDRNVLKEAIKNLEFDVAKATLRSKSFESLDKVADLLVTKNFSLKLSGHTDSDGNKASNLSLSKDRAESIKAYLVSRGANPSRIEATGYGQSQPIATNKTAKGKQMNRRVEFTIY